MNSKASDAKHSTKHTTEHPPTPTIHSKPQGSDAETQASRGKATEAVNNPEVCQHPATDEIPGHLAAKMHALIPEKPPVQHINEQLSDDTATGYAASKPGFNLDEAQLASIKDKNSQEPEVKDATNEIKNRVEEGHKQKAHKA